MFSTIARLEGPDPDNSRADDFTPADATHGLGDSWIFRGDPLAVFAASTGEPQAPMVVREHEPDGSWSTSLLIGGEERDLTRDTRGVLDLSESVALACAKAGVVPASLPVITDVETARQQAADLLMAIAVARVNAGAGGGLR